MKKLCILFLAISSFQVAGQVKGNKKIVTEEFEMQRFDSLYIGLTGIYEIDLSNPANVSLTGDENLIENIKKEVVNGQLIIDQKEWISGSIPFIIKIGAPGLKKITQSSHSTTKVKNVDNIVFSVNVEVGEMSVFGKTEEFIAKVGTGKIFAEHLIADKGEFYFDSWGTIQVNVLGNISSVSENNGSLIVNGVKDGSSAEDNEKGRANGIKFIKFELRNNSSNRKNFYVEGPKPDGSSFSYGFPMMPYQKRNKDWTNGTKVYEVNHLGLRKLVKEIQLTDEGKVVDIFKN